jgi:hypothetical protein
VLWTAGKPRHTMADALTLCSTDSGTYGTARRRARSAAHPSCWVLLLRALFPVAPSLRLFFFP